MGQEHTILVLPFKIKLKKDSTKNACVNLCSISEVVKSSGKMTLLYPKIVAMWQVQVKSPRNYFDSFLIQANSRQKYITDYCTLILSRTILK